MALSTADQIQEMYIAYYGRPADPRGLTYWTEQADAAGSFNPCILAFGTAPEATYVQDALSTTQLVNNLYNQLFDRDAEVAGLNFWSDLVDSGQMPLVNIAWAMINGAQGTDADAVANKLAAANAFTTALDTTDEIIGYSGNNACDTARTWLATVDSTAASLTAAQASLDTTISSIVSSSSSSTGTTFTLTSSIDNITGTGSNDTIIADNVSASSADQVNGAAGTDTIKIYTPAGITDIPTLTSVEVVELIGSTANTDLSGVSGMTSLVLDDSNTTLTYTIGADVAVTLKGMADGDAVTLTSTTTDTTQDLTVTNMGTIAGAGVTVNADGIAVTTINVAASGTVAATTDSDITLASTGTETTVNVTGTGDLALATAASVVTLAASGYTGNLTYVSGATTTATSITTASGNDTVTATAAVNYTIDLGAGNDTLTTADAAGELTSADSITGGDGTDVLGISSAEALNLDDGDAADAAVLAKVTGFEKLRITDALGAGPLAINNLGFNSIQVTTALGADATINGFTSGMTFESRLDANAANDYIIGMTGATGAGTNSDTININLNADLATNDAMRSISFDLAGINIVNIAANDRDTTTNPDTDANGEEGYTVDLAGATAGDSANISTINVTGAQKVSYTVNAATTALATYDASAATGEQTFVGTAFVGTQGITIKGGSKADAITGSALADVIDGGAGNDAITGGVGADVMTGGAGVDTFTFANTATGLPSATNFDTITDFAKASDIIDGPVALTIGVNASTGAGVATINAEGIASFNAADDTLAERLTAVAAAVELTTATTAGDIAIFEFGSDSYAFITDATAGLNATDVLIKLAGVTGLTDSTITAGDLTIA